MRHGPADSFRGVPPAQNLEAAGLRAQHPTWTQEQAAGEVRKIFRAAHAEVFRSIVEPLKQSELPYFVTGSVAPIVYGKPRLTMDVDRTGSKRPNVSKDERTQ